MGLQSVQTKNRFDHQNAKHVADVSDYGVLPGADQ